MLVTFTCPAYADITYLGEVAIQLLKLMGQSGKVPSALKPEDVQGALQKLEAALKTENLTPQKEHFEGEEDGEPAVTLSHRALPLIELLKAAAKEECHVMWDKPG